jgi:hypothetical protein
MVKNEEEDIEGWLERAEQLGSSSEARRALFALMDGDAGLRDRALEDLVGFLAQYGVVVPEGMRIDCRKKWLWRQKDEPQRLEEICLSWVITKHPLPPTA